MSLKDAFRVDEVPSDRWDVALEVIRAGSPMVVVVREVTMSFQRYKGWSGDDGKVHVCVYTDTAPSSLTPESVAEDGRNAVRLLADLVEQDRRLGDLLNGCGWSFDYVFDYGHGGAQIGTISADGTVTLL